MARIFAFDDDALILRTIQTMLASGGHEAALAGGTADGVRQLPDHHFDLVIFAGSKGRKHGPVVT
jgi:DNA-binding NtrC family response regulator